MVLWPGLMIGRRSFRSSAVACSALLAGYTTYKGNPTCGGWVSAILAAYPGQGCGERLRAAKQVDERH